MLHQYRSNGYNIVMDVNSGSIHVVDDVVYDLIELLDSVKGEKNIRNAVSEDLIETLPYEELEDVFSNLLTRYSDEQLREAYDEVCELISQDILFSDDVYEDFVIDFKKRKTVVKALCLHISHDCNLACRYCFAEEGKYHQSRRELMSYEVGKQALDFLVANSGNRHNLEF